MSRLIKTRNKMNILRGLKRLYYIVFKGFDPADTWNLDCSFARWMVPRLKYFKANLHGYPSELTEADWDDVLDKMILAFEWCAGDRDDEDYPAYVEDGLDLFRKWYFCLWD